MSRTTAPASPRMARSTSRFSPSVSGAVSTWMRRISPGLPQNPGLPQRSKAPRREPSTRTTSAWLRAFRLPKPIGIRYSGWSSGMVPRAVTLVVTGQPRNSARAMISLLAPEQGAAAGVDEGPAGVGQHLRRLGDQLGVALLGRRRAVAGRRQDAHLRLLALLEEDVHRQVEVHGPRPAGEGHAKGLLHQARGCASSGRRRRSTW